MIEVKYFSPAGFMKYFYLQPKIYCYTRKRRFHSHSVTIVEDELSRQDQIDTELDTCNFKQLLNLGSQV
jgi:hypothetical protein